MYNEAEEKINKIKKNKKLVAEEKDYDSELCLLSCEQMNRWINEWMNKLMSELISKWINKLMNKWISKWMNE